MVKDTYTILLVEDNPDHLTFEKKTLQKLEMVSRVVSAGSSREARDKLQNDEIDLIVLDYDLPDSDGLDFLETLIQKDSGIAVVMVTGLGNERVAVRAMKLGAYDYVVKDRDYLKTLPDVIGRTLERLELSRSLKKMENQLRESEERFQKLFGNANLGFVSINYETKKLINPNKMALEMTGFTREELESKFYCELVSPEDRERIVSYYQSMFENESEKASDQTDFEFWMLTKSEKKKFVNCTATPFPQIGEMFITLNDITDRKKLEEQLRIAHEKLKKYTKELEDEVDDLKQKLVIEPALEIPMDTEQKYNLDSGVCYLMKETKLVKSYDIFKDFVSHGTFGLCISRTHPGRIQRLYQLEKTPLVWLSRNEETESAISGGDLGGLVHTISQFIETSRGSIVMLDGLEYIVTLNGFERTIRYLNDLIENIAIYDSILILPIHPDGLDKKEMAILERTTESMELVD